MIDCIVYIDCTCNGDPEDIALFIRRNFCSFVTEGHFKKCRRIGLVEQCKSTSLLQRSQRIMTNGSKTGFPWLRNKKK